MKLFTSATLKLAGWYLLILMAVSLLFSVIIFQVARSEVESRLSHIMEQREFVAQYFLAPPLTQQEQLNNSTTNLLISLVYINVIVLLAGGAGAYLLARHTLKPIEEAHRSQSRFVSNASHQLRTPLAIMKAETELVLANKRTKKEDLRNTLASNLEEINHLSKLSTMLLELSRSERTLNAANDSIDLLATVKEIVSIRKINRRTNIQSTGSPKLNSHSTAVREIINILIDNSIKHSPPKTPIDISLKQTKSSVILQISNYGESISQQQIPRIFERFYRSGSANGYGLGLSLVKQLVQAIDGSIAATSQPEGLITFTVTFSKKSIKKVG